MIKLAKYNQSYLVATLSPCLSSTPPGCAKTDKSDACYANLFPLYQDIGCCLAYFVRGMNIPEAPSNAKTFAPLVGSILQTCFPAGAPTRCTQKKVKITFPLNNVAYAFVQQLSANTLQTYFGGALGVNPQYLTVSCSAMTNGSTTCDIEFYPDDTNSATAYVLDFQASINAANQTLWLVEFDSASVDKNGAGGGCRQNVSMDAYSAQSASVTTSDDCLNFAPPVNYQWDPKTQTCQPTTSNAMNVMASPLIFVASCFLALLFL